MRINMVPFKTLEGKIIKEIKQENDSIKFICSDESEYTMEHIQDCCESVEIKEINGDFEDIIDSLIVLADESSNSGDEDGDDWSSTWTFYRIQSQKGFVELTWYGTSNGYYSERVDFFETKPPRSL